MVKTPSTAERTESVPKKPVWFVGLAGQTNRTQKERRSIDPCWIKLTGDASHSGKFACPGMYQRVDREHFVQCAYTRLISDDGVLDRMSGLTTPRSTTVNPVFPRDGAAARPAAAIGHINNKPGRHGLLVLRTSRLVCGPSVSMSLRGPSLQS
jgi:hypothetical protein